MKVVTTFCIVGIIILISGKTGFSQNTAKIENLFDEAEQYFYNEDYRNALPLYKRLDTSAYSSSNITYKIGVCYVFSHYETEDAIFYLKSAAKNVTENYKKRSFYEKKAPVEVYYYLGRAYQFNESYEKALSAYQQFQQYISDENFHGTFYLKQRIRSCKLALEEKNKKFSELTFSRLKSPVNQNKTSSVNPIIFEGENKLIYVSKRKFYDAVMLSQNVNDKWITPINITMQLGSGGQFYPVSISPGGDSLFLLHTKANDIYFSTYSHVRDKWSEVNLLDSAVNTQYDETNLALLPGGTTAYVTSDRPGSKGGLDIFRCKKSADGNWDVAEPLAGNINTSYNEQSPCFIESGNKMFFTSEGHYNFGGYDIFYTTRISDTLWGLPVNLGPKLNSSRDEKLINTTKYGVYGYIDRIYDTTNDIRNIYRFPLLSAETQENIEVNIILSSDDYNDLSFAIMDYNTNDTISTYKKKETNEKPVFSLYPGIYKIKVWGRQYGTKTEYLSVPNLKVIKRVYIGLGWDSEVPTKTSERTRFKFYIIAGSFSDQARAEAYKSNLISNGYNDAVILVGKERYRVAIARFIDKSDALKNLKDLRKSYKPSLWLLKKDD